MSVSPVLIELFVIVIPVLLILLRELYLLRVDRKREEAEAARKAQEPPSETP